MRATQGWLIADLFREAAGFERSHRHAFVDDAGAFAAGVCLGDGAEECLGVGVCWVVEDFGACARFDDLAFVHDGDAVADVLDDGHVVGDEEVGEAELVAEVGEEVEDLRLDGDVEGGGGFVADDEAWVECECAGDADALSLAA